MAGWTRYGQSLRSDLRVNAAQIEGRGLPNSGQLLRELVATYSPTPIGDPDGPPTSRHLANDSREPQAPKCERGLSVGPDGLTSQQREHFGERLDDAESETVANQARYERYVCRAQNAGRTPLSATDWVRADQRLRENADRGGHEESSVLDALGIAGTGGEDVSLPSRGGGRVQVDAVTNSAVVEVRSVPDTPDPEGGPRVVHDSEALREARVAAKDSDKVLVVVLTNADSRNVRPSRPLSAETVVLHRDSSSGEFSKWDPFTESWQPISVDAARRWVSN
ncbi:MAG TPA: hypothetical protein VFQ61_33475 [Polyangiaceae bacterium]|nr:hypothetical protein [Polyangiaceae bacterium]